MQVASNIGNCHSKFGHTGPLGSRIIRYVVCATDRQTDGQKQRLLLPSLWSGHNKLCYVTNKYDDEDVKKNF